MRENLYEVFEEADATFGYMKNFEGLMLNAKKILRNTKKWFKNTERV